MQNLVIAIVASGMSLWGCSGNALTSRAEPQPSLSNKAHLQVPFFPDKTDQCGPSTLASVLSYWGQPMDPLRIRQDMYQAKLKGTLPMDLLLSAQAHGLNAVMVRGQLDTLRDELHAGRPVIAMLNVGFSLVPVDHYVVITGFDDDRKGVFAHSAGTKNEFIPYKRFLRSWEKTDYWTLLARPST